MKMGACFSSGPIRRILLASAAIPGAFPPTMFDVTLDGVAYQEMHVDGGAFAQACLYPVGMTQNRRKRMAGGQLVVPATAYIIRNGRLDPEWATTERSTMGIAVRAIATMISVSGIKPANHKENRRDRRLAKNQNGKRQVVVVAKERGGRTVPAVFRAEVDALGFIIQRVHPASKLMADEATSWNAI
jgi:predicted acylesterase/phospholipase RssA